MNTCENLTLVNWFDPSIFKALYAVLEYFRHYAKAFLLRSSVLDFFYWLWHFIHHSSSSAHKPNSFAIIIFDLNSRISLMSCYGGNFFSGVAFLIYSNQISSGSTFDLERQKAFWKNWYYDNAAFSFRTRARYCTKKTKRLSVSFKLHASKAIEQLSLRSRHVSLELCPKPLSPQQTDHLWVSKEAFGQTAKHCYTVPYFFCSLAAWNVWNDIACSNTSWQRRYTDTRQLLKFRCLFRNLNRPYPKYDTLFIPVAYTYFLFGSLKYFIVN